ncbi:MAG: flagellar export chaperone FliS [Terriglobia bacterium]
MTTAEHWKAYRQRAAQTEDAASILIEAYDRIISLIYSAARAIEARNIEKKTEDLRRAFTFIAHLENGLDFKRGGEAARMLGRFYALSRKDIFNASVRLDVQALSKAAEGFAEVRGIWEKARSFSVGSSPNLASGPPPQVPPQAQGFSPAAGADPLEISSSSRWSA